MYIVILSLTDKERYIEKCLSSDRSHCNIEKQKIVSRKYDVNYKTLNAWCNEYKKRVNKNNDNYKNPLVTFKNTFSKRDGWSTELVVKAITFLNEEYGFTISELCSSFGISRQHYYRVHKQLIEKHKLVGHKEENYYDDYYFDYKDGRALKRKQY